MAYAYVARKIAHIPKYFRNEKNQRFPSLRISMYCSIVAGSNKVPTMVHPHTAQIMLQILNIPNKGRKTTKHPIMAYIR